MRAGFKFKNEFGVNMVLDETTPFKFLGEFKTRGDEPNGFIEDNAVEGRNIAIILSKVRLVESGTNNMYMYPSKLVVNGNRIEWEYSHIRPSATHEDFHGIADMLQGVDSIYEITWKYGYF